MSCRHQPEAIEVQHADEDATHLYAECRNCGAEMVTVIEYDDWEVLGAPKPAPPPPPRPATCEPWEEAIIEVDHVLGLLDGLPSRADEFVDNATDYLTGVRSWIEENQHVTTKQLEGVDSWASGAAKWMDR